MLKLNPNGWYVRKFLQINPAYESLPWTICQLIRASLIPLLQWSIILAMAAFFTVTYLLGAGILVVAAVTDHTVASLGQISPLFSVGIAVFAVLTGGIAICSTIFVIHTYSRYRREKLQAEQKEYFATHGVYPPKVTNPFHEFFKGVWARIHDKTCVMIDWSDNDPNPEKPEAVDPKPEPEVVRVVSSIPVTTTDYVARKKFENNA